MPTAPTGYLNYNWQLNFLLMLIVLEHVAPKIIPVMHWIIEGNKRTEGTDMLHSNKYNVQFTSLVVIQLNIDCRYESDNVI